MTLGAMRSVPSILLNLPVSATTFLANRQVIMACLLTFSLYWCYNMAMIQSLKDMLGEWNSRYNERAKLQHAYIVACVAGIVVAGLVGLLNYDASRAILRVCFAGLGIVV